jgi:hypothetical protein
MQPLFTLIKFCISEIKLQRFRIKLQNAGIKLQNFII